LIGSIDHPSEIVPSTIHLRTWPYGYNEATHGMGQAEVFQCDCPEPTSTLKPSDAPERYTDVLLEQLVRKIFHLR
jgi:hypothetical protein